MSTFWFVLSMICVAVVIATTALGAHIYRWELIVWAAVAGSYAFRLWAADR